MHGGPRACLLDQTGRLSGSGVGRTGVDHVVDVSEELDRGPPVLLLRPDRATWAWAGEDQAERASASLPRWFGRCRPDEARSGGPKGVGRC